jgi:hypothetical protein
MGSFLTNKNNNMSQPEYTPYKDALTNSMTFLGEQPNTVFIGQQLLWHGNPMSTTIGNVSKDKMIEVPVMEESQMGMSLGMAMAGDFVITFYPRWDFLICATNQLVNHVDKINLMSQGKWDTNMIIRLYLKQLDSLLQQDPMWVESRQRLDVFKLLMDDFIFTIEELIDITGVIKYVFNNLFALYYMI